MPKITEQEYQELIALSNELTDHLEQFSTHVNRFNIVLEKLTMFISMVTFQPPKVGEQHADIIEQLSETTLLLSEDFTAIELNGKIRAEKLRKIGEK